MAPTESLLLSPIASQAPSVGTIICPGLLMMCSVVVSVLAHGGVTHQVMVLFAVELLFPH